MKTDYADQSTMLLWQMPPADLRRVALFLGKKIAACEQREDWRHELQLLEKKLDVIRQLAKLQ